MAVRSKLFPSDEELGKRDDDHRKKQARASWLPRGKAPIVRPKRVLGLLVACFLTWLFVHNIPQDLGPAEGRRTPWSRHREAVSPELPKRYAEQGQAPADVEPPQGAPPEAAIKEEASDLPPQNFEGPIRFFYLAASLHGIARTNGHRPDNRNILFAASDLKSAADIIPLACEMASWKRNFVHMVLMGRDEIPLEEIMKLNGVDSESCDVYWHDGRPDYAQYSTDSRMEVSVAGALGHIDSFMHPQAVITANAINEDDFFARGVFRKTKDLHQTHIELPTTKQLANIAWLTRLEAQALRNWHAATVDILIQAPHDTSGSIVRLLMSLDRADYGAFVPPRLTIELPPKLNDDTMIFLDNFRWPPHRLQEGEPINSLALRRRIPDKHLSADEASTRFIESFYPSHTHNSHVLILSPQVELSPAYYHYLKYHLLEYKYSSNNSTDLFGISLDSPQIKLDGTKGFEPPARVRPSGEEELDPPITPYLWQAPNSNAALYFADKWIEFHSFLTRYYTAARHPTTKQHFRDRKKAVTKKLPAWTESLLDLMRARGYRMIYPNPQPSSPAGNAVAIVHEELLQLPEEWIGGRQGMHVEKLTEPSDDTVLGVPNDHLISHTASTEANALKISRNLLTSLLQVLPVAPSFARKPQGSSESASKVKTPRPALSLAQMPLIDYKGETVTNDDLTLRAANAAIQYRLTGGGCTADESQDKEVLLGSADDLFCVGAGDEDDVDESSEDDEADDPLPGNNVAAKPSKTTGKPRTQQYEGSGAASTINAVVNPARFEETARAGFNAKTNPKEKDDDAKHAPIGDDGLTDMQRADLEKWKAKQRKETGEVPDAPKPKGTYTRAVTDEEAKPTAEPDARKQREPDELRDALPRSDADDHRPPDQRPRKVNDAAVPTSTKPSIAGARPAPSDADPAAPPEPTSPAPSTTDKDKAKTKTPKALANPKQDQQPIPAVEELRDTQSRTKAGQAAAKEAGGKPVAETIAKSKEDDRSHESGTKYNPPVVDAAAYGARELEEVPRGERVRASEEAREKQKVVQGSDADADEHAKAIDQNRRANEKAPDHVSGSGLPRKVTEKRVDQRREKLGQQKEEQQGRDKDATPSDKDDLGVPISRKTKIREEEKERIKMAREKTQKQRIVAPDLQDRMRQLERAEEMAAG